MKHSVHSQFSPKSSPVLSFWFSLAPICFAGLTLPLGAFAKPTPAVQERVREGQLVKLKLHNILTTENVEKGDPVDFDVAEDVVLNNHVVIAKGAVARGTVTKVKGAGKKKAKDASVSFRFLSVRAVDNQELPLRVRSFKSKKEKKESEEEIEENSPIPGLAERMIGAEKGREYAAYTDGAAVVNALDAPQSTAGSVTGPPATPTTAPATPTTPVVPALTEPEPEQAVIDFKSDPTGADIVVDGTFRGNTPLDLQVPPGRHQIEIRFGGYRPWTRIIWIEPESHPSIRATLERP